MQLQSFIGDVVVAVVAMYDDGDYDGDEDDGGDGDDDGDDDDVDVDNEDEDDGGDDDDREPTFCVFWFFLCFSKKQTSTTFRLLCFA